MKIALIGTGNILFKDEGIGVYAVHFIRANYQFDCDIECIDGGVLGFSLMHYFQEFDRVIIIDTITMSDDVAGSIYTIPAEELLGLSSVKQNAHEVEIVEMLEICTLAGDMAEITIVGVVPEDIVSVEIGLSATLTKAFDALVSEVLSVLQKESIAVTQKHERTLDAIMKQFQ